MLFVVVEGRVAGAARRPARCCATTILVGATLAILIVAGTINALMYVLSLYFQDPAALGMSALEAGLATLPAAAAMIAITPLITPLAVKIGGAAAIALGFGLAAVGFAVLAFVEASWTYAAFVLPLVVLAAGLGLANGPASSASTSAVSADQVGQASGISNMARYVGAASPSRPSRRSTTRSPNDHREARRVGLRCARRRLSRASLVMAICSAAGIALALLMARHRSGSRPGRSTAPPPRPRPAHTIPTEPSAAA